MVAALIAIIALLMLGGAAGTGWTADLEKPVKKHVADKTHREAVLDALDDYEEGMEKVGKSLQTHFTELLETHLDYHSTAADFDAVTQQLKQDQEQAFHLDTEVHKLMKEKMSKQEWSAVFSGEK